MTPNQPTTSAANVARLTATLNLLLAIWLFISPWVYGSYSQANAWNSWIVGALIAIFAISRLASPAGSMMFIWLNLVLGAWTFASPWVYSFTAERPRFVNSLCVGALVFIFAAVALRSTSHTPAPRAM